MFEAYYTGMQERLLPVEQFHPFPRITDRKAWQGLTKEYKQLLLSNAEPFLNFDFPVPPAHLYMDFYRNGNRTRYQNLLYNKRRIPLIYLTLAECIENKGRYIDTIIDGVWSTLEEASWVVPAHNTYKGASPLPGSVTDPDKAYVDLFAAECGSLMAWVYYMLGEKLDEQAPQVTERILFELKRRIFTPVLEKDDFGWMGFDGHHVNNWNPWISSNVMFAASVACKDEEMRARIFEKTLRCVENFVAVYAPDGGCEEGPCYWGAAGASMFDCVDILYDVTGGKVDFFKEPLIYNMCSYIYKMHIDYNYFVCYADADAKTTSVPSLIYRMGVCFGDKNLKALGASLYHELRSYQDPRLFTGGASKLYRSTKAVFLDKELSKKQVASPYVRDAYFPGIQVMTARSKKGTKEGLYLSAKGGTNGESHNHNDIGSFIVFSDGQPAIIDIGRATYVKNTFNEHRYELPMMQSQYHNLPMVNGKGQKEGVEFCAVRVAYDAKPNLVVFTLGLEKAYEESVGISRWDRTYLFDRKENTITLTDDFALEQASEVQFALMLAKKPTVKANVLTVKSEGRPLTVTFDERLTCTVEPFDCSWDEKLTHAWGKQVYRVLFTVKDVQDGRFTMTIAQK